MKDIIHDLNGLSADVLKFANAFSETGNRHVYKRLDEFHQTIDRLYHQVRNVHNGKVGRAGYVARLLSSAVVMHKILRERGSEAVILTDVASKIGEIWFFELKTLKQSDALHEGMVQKFWDDAMSLWPGTFHKAETIWNETVNPPDKIQYSKWDNVDIRVQPHNAVEVIQFWVVAHEPSASAGPILG